MEICLTLPDPKKNTRCYFYFLLCPYSNEPKYLGKTINIKRRLIEHVKDAAYYKTPLANWINELKAKNKRPVLKIIDSISITDDWKKVEVEYIKKYRKSYKLLNTANGGQGNEFGCVVSEKTRKILSINQSKAVVQYCAETGKYIDDYVSAKVAAEKLGLHRERITAVCNRTKDFPLTITPAKTRGKDIQQYDKKGNLIRTWTSSHLAAKELNLDHSAILKVCKGQHKNQKSHGNFVWKFA